MLIIRRLGDLCGSCYYNAILQTKHNFRVFSVVSRLSQHFIEKLIKIYFIYILWRRIRPTNKNYFKDFPIFSLFLLKTNSCHFGFRVVFWAFWKKSLNLGEIHRGVAKTANFNVIYCFNPSHAKYKFTISSKTLNIHFLFVFFCK